jgi:hypothetical protein
LPNSPPVASNSPEFDDEVDRGVEGEAGASKSCDSEQANDQFGEGETFLMLFEHWSLQ